MAYLALSRPIELEKLIDVVSTFNSGTTLIVVVPKCACSMTGAKKGTKFQVKIDGRNRLIYEPLPSPEVKK